MYAGPTDDNFYHISIDIRLYQTFFFYINISFKVCPITLPLNRKFNTFLWNIEKKMVNSKLVRPITQIPFKT